MILFLLAQSMRDWPAIIQGVLVGGPCLPLVAGDLRLAVVVVGLLGQLGHHLRPGGLGDEQPVGVIGAAGIEDLAVPQQFLEPLPVSSVTWWRSTLPTWSPSGSATVRKSLRLTPS